MAKKPLRVPKKELAKFNGIYNEYKDLRNQYGATAISKASLEEVMADLFKRIQAAETAVNEFTMAWEEAFGKDAQIDIQTGIVTPPNEENK